MKLNKQTLKLLISCLAKTRSEEIDCDECFRYLPEMAECQLNNAMPSRSLDLAKEHIEICADCFEEIELLKSCLLRVPNVA